MLSLDTLCPVQTKTYFDTTLLMILEDTFCKVTHYTAIIQNILELSCKLSYSGQGFNFMNDRVAHCMNGCSGRS